MTTSEQPLNFVLADQSHLDYLTDRTVALHDFESESSDTQQLISTDFKQHIKDWLSAELELNNTLIFRIFSNQSLIGFAHVKVLPTPNKFTQFDTYGYIQSLWIEPEYRGQSIGKQVVCFIESVFRDQQIGYYEVNTSASNQLARSFWKGVGMQAHSISYRKML